MPQKIYYGNIELMNCKTRKKIILQNQLFKELDRPTDSDLRSKVLRKINPKEREQYQIIKLCFETAKHIANTNY